MQSIPNRVFFIWKFDRIKDALLKYFLEIEQVQAFVLTKYFYKYSSFKSRKKKKLNRHIKNMSKRKISYYEADLPIFYDVANYFFNIIITMHCKKQNIKLKQAGNRCAKFSGYFKLFYQCSLHCLVRDFDWI